MREGCLDNNAYSHPKMGKTAGGRTLHCNHRAAKKAEGRQGMARAVNLLDWKHLGEEGINSRSEGEKTLCPRSRHEPHGKPRYLFIARPSWATRFFITKPCSGQTSTRTPFSCKVSAMMGPTAATWTLSNPCRNSLSRLCSFATSKRRSDCAELVKMIASTSPAA